jgi:hypothetical protein
MTLHDSEFASCLHHSSVISKLSASLGISAQQCKSVSVIVEAVT